MNGSEKMILDAVKENGREIANLHETITIVKVDFMQVKTREKEHHIENTKKFDTIFEKLDGVGSVDDLKEEVRWLKWVIFIVIILGIFMKVGS